MLENDVRVLWGRLLRKCQAETIKDTVSYKGKPSEMSLGTRKTYMERTNLSLDFREVVEQKRQATKYTVYQPSEGDIQTLQNQYINKAPYIKRKLKTYKNILQHSKFLELPRNHSGGRHTHKLQRMSRPVMLALSRKIVYTLKNNSS